MVGGCSEGRCETGVKRKEPPTDRERERQKRKEGSLCQGCIVMRERETGSARKGRIIGLSFVPIVPISSFSSFLPISQKSNLHYLYL